MPVGDAEGNFYLLPGTYLTYQRSSLLRTPRLGSIRHTEIDEFYPFRLGGGEAVGLSKSFYAGLFDLWTKA